MTDLTPPTDARRQPVLEVDDLTVRLRTKQGLLEAIRKVSFDVGEGETVGLVGESGCGKSMTALAIAGLLPPSSKVDGAIRLQGTDLVNMEPKRRRRLGGRDIGMVFQEPVASLNPVLTVGEQVSEVARYHLKLGRKESLERASEMLDRVGIPPTRGLLREYPHQLSGGMCQRVMLAIALMCGPRLVIADEPTTALDVTIQAQMLELLTEATLTSGASLLLISHDLGVIARTCDRVAVMYAGQIVETAPTEDIIDRAQHPYTAALIESVPDPESGVDRLRAIPGRVPQLHEMPEGCRFRDRCNRADDQCFDEPQLERRGAGNVKCWHPVTSQTQGA